MANQNTAQWTPERTERLKALHAQGMSGSQIAAELGHVTRNAVIGKVHRLGLEKRGVPRKYQKRRSPAENGAAMPKSRRFKPEPFVCGEAADVQPLNIGLHDLLPDDCRYPYGDGPFTFCGHPKLIGSSYCRQHAALCDGATRKSAFVPQKQSTKFLAGWV